jgi:hypothetical protein
MNGETTGEAMMGIKFIPGNNDKAQNIKEKCAHVINDLDSLKDYHESGGEPSAEKLAAIEAAKEDVVTVGLRAALVAAM